MIQKYGKFFLMTMMVLALGLCLNACSDSDDDPTTPPPGGGDDTDTTAPVMVSTSPDAGSTGLDINQIITATFSEPLDETTLMGNITLSPGTVVDLIHTGTEVQIVHNPFTPGDAITLTFATGITDTSGNHLAAAVTKQYWVATDEVLVIEHTPADGSTDFLRNTPVTIKFNQNMDISSLAAGITASVPDKADLPFGISSMGNSIYSMVFNDDLPADTEVTITIGTTCQSNAGFTLDTAVVFSFTTGADLDTTPPEIVSFEPASGSTVSAYNGTLVVTFDKPMNEYSFYPIRADVPTMIAFESSQVEGSWNEDMTVLTVVMATPLPSGTTMLMQFGDFIDSLGNVNTSHPTWFINIEGTADHYPVDERLIYLFDIYEDNGEEKIYIPLNVFRNVWTSSDHFMHQQFDDATETWNEWDYMIRTSTAIELDGFHEEYDGTAEEVVFDNPVKFLNHPTVTASWTDAVVVTMTEGSMDVTFEAEVLPGETEIPFNMNVKNSSMSNGFFGNNKGVSVDLFFPKCRTMVQHIEGSMGGNVVFTSNDTLVFCPGFGLVMENASEVSPDEPGERYTTSKIIGVDFAYED